jgi:hypothetical protein
MSGSEHFGPPPESLARIAYLATQSLDDTIHDISSDGILIEESPSDAAVVVLAEETIVATPQEIEIERREFSETSHTSNLLTARAQRAVVSAETAEPQSYETMKERSLMDCATETFEATTVNGDDTAVSGGDPPSLVADDSLLSFDEIERIDREGLLEERQDKSKRQTSGSERSDDTEFHSIDMAWMTSEVAEKTRWEHSSSTGSDEFFDAVSKCSSISVD